MYVLTCLRQSEICFDGMVDCKFCNNFLFYVSITLDFYFRYNPFKLCLCSSSESKPETTKLFILDLYSY